MNTASEIAAWFGPLAAVGTLALIWRQWKVRQHVGWTAQQVVKNLSDKRLVFELTNDGPAAAHHAKMWLLLRSQSDMDSWWKDLLREERKIGPDSSVKFGYDPTDRAGPYWLVVEWREPYTRRIRLARGRPTDAGSFILEPVSPRRRRFISQFNGAERGRISGRILDPNDL